MIGLELMPRLSGAKIANSKCQLCHARRLVINAPGRPVVHFVGRENRRTPQSSAEEME
jgi:cytochrome c5